MIYDRLGTGLSEKPDAYDIVQGPLQIKILNQLIVLARAGKLSGSFAKNQTLTVPDIAKFIAIGHSMGSIAYTTSQRDRWRRPNRIPSEQ